MVGEPGMDGVTCGIEIGDTSGTVMRGTGINANRMSIVKFRTQGNRLEGDIFGL